MNVINIEEYQSHFSSPGLNIQTAIGFSQFLTDFQFLDQVSRSKTSERILFLWMIGRDSTVKQYWILWLKIWTFRFKNCKKFEFFLRIPPFYLSSFTRPKLSETSQLLRKSTKSSKYLQGKTIWKEFLTLTPSNQNKFLLLPADFYCFQVSQGRKWLRPIIAETKRIRRCPWVNIIAIKNMRWYFGVL